MADSVSAIFVFIKIIDNMNNCNCNEGNTYHIGMGCCVPSIMPADNFYTKQQTYNKEEIDDMISSASTSGCCITEEEVDEKISAATDDMATKEWVGEQGYATEQWVEDKHYITGVDLSDYATEEYVQESVSGKQDTLIAGQNITISGNVISSEATPITIDPTLNSGSTNPVANSAITQALLEKQDNLTAGNGISIQNNVIAASGSTQCVTVTQAQYDALEQAGLLQPNTFYVVTDAEGADLSNYWTSGETIAYINGRGFATLEDLTDYYTSAEMDTILGDMATKTWVLSQNYATYNQLMQHIQNLQDQIDALSARLEECCTPTAETLYRWVTMTGANDYVCSGTTKMTKEQQQSSSDGGDTWTLTGQYRTGDTILETDSLDCGYVPSSASVKFYGEYIGGDDFTIYCNGNPQITLVEVQTDAPQTIDFLTAATFGSCAKLIGNNCLGAAQRLKTVVMEEGVEGIQKQAFAISPVLSAATIPDSVTSIGSEVFSGCTSLKNLSMGSGVTSVGIGAFKYCSGLTGDIDLPSVTEIGTGAFQNCTKISGVTIGSGCTRIDGSAFKNCSGLTSITVESTNCYLAPQAFDNTNNCPIYVPASVVETYKSTYAWSSYKTRITAIT